MNYLDLLGQNYFDLFKGKLFKHYLDLLGETVEKLFGSLGVKTI